MIHIYSLKDILLSSLVMMILLYSLCTSLGLYTIHYNLDFKQKCSDFLLQNMSFNEEGSFFLEFIFHVVLIVQSFISECMYRGLGMYLFVTYAQLSPVFSMLFISVFEALYHVCQYYFRIRNVGEYFFGQYFALHFLYNIVIFIHYHFTGNLFSCICIQYVGTTINYMDMKHYYNELKTREETPKIELPNPRSLNKENIIEETDEDEMEQENQE